MSLAKLVKRYYKPLCRTLVCLVLCQLLFNIFAPDLTQTLQAGGSNLGDTSAIANPAANPQAPDAANLSANAVTTTNPTSVPTATRQAWGKLPITFNANAGQLDSQVKFTARGKGYNIFLTPTELVLDLRKAPVVTNTPCPIAKTPANPTKTPSTCSSKEANKLTTPNRGIALRMNLVGATANPSLTGLEPQTAKTHYLSPTEPTRQHTDVPTFAKVTYTGIYPGIDLLYNGSTGKLEYDFNLAPNANPDLITMQFKGADRLELAANGDLVVWADNEKLIHKAPLIYQTLPNGQRQSIKGAYLLKANNQVGFTIGAYDHAKPLTIDPVVEYATYIGSTGNGFDEGRAIAVDSSGNTYITGTTQAALQGGDFPTTTGAYQINPGGGLNDVFVTKFNPAGTTLIFSTYLGGSGQDEAYGLALDSAGNVYVTGFTTSTNYPVTVGALQTTKKASGDAFVTKVISTGTALGYSTYLGGNADDYGNGIAVDSSGNAYITGNTDSTNFPVSPGAYQTTKNGASMFLTKLNSTGTAKVYSTYLGGTDGFNESSNAIVVDSSGSAYITGKADEDSFPLTAGAYITNTADTGAFVTKFNPTGNGLVFSTFLGPDEATGLALDGSNNVYVTGRVSGDYLHPTTGAYRTTRSGLDDGFTLKLRADGSGVYYASYLGGSDIDYGTGIKADSSGRAYVVGSSYSTNFPVATGAYQSSLAGDGDIFLSVFKADGSGLDYSSYYGGVDYDAGNGVALDSLGNAYVVGTTSEGAATVEFGDRGGWGAIIIKFAMVKLVFTTQPGDAKANGLLSPQPVLAAQAPNGTLLTNLNKTVTLSIRSSSGTTGATLNGTTTKPLVGGVATFNDLSINTAGMRYTFDASIPNSPTDPNSNANYGSSWNLNISPLSTAINTSNGYFHTITPTRLYDSRKCQPNDSFRTGWLNPSGERKYQGRGSITTDLLDGNGNQIVNNSIPNNATAILANVTIVVERTPVDNPTGPCQFKDGALGNGKISVVPDIDANTFANTNNISNVWYQGGLFTVNNFSVIGLSDEGWFKIFNKGDQSVDITIDVYGYLDNNTAGGGQFKPLSGRLYDSRPSIATNPVTADRTDPPQGAGAGPLLRGSENNTNIRTIQAGGLLGIPKKASAVIVNVTAVETKFGGYFSLYPTSGTVPIVSAINWNDSTLSNTNIPTDIPNMTIVPLNSTDGNFNITVGGNDNAAGAQVVIDVLGYVVPSNFPDGEYYKYLSAPAILYNSQGCNGSCPGNATTGILEADGKRNINGRGILGIPSDAKAIVIHLVARNMSGGGFLRVFPSSSNPPATSNVNYNKVGEVVGNLAFVELGSNGQFTVQTSKNNSAHFEINVLGYLTRNGVAPNCNTSPLNIAGSVVSNQATPNITQTKIDETKYNPTTTTQTNQIPEESNLVIAANPTPNSINKRSGRYQFNLAASGSTIVWEDRAIANNYADLTNPKAKLNDEDSSDILGFDFTTNQPIVVTTAEGDQSNPAISGSTVVWTSRKPNCPTCSREIRAKDLKTGTEYLVSNGFGDNYFPAVEGNTVVWVKSDNNGQQLVSTELGSKVYSTLKIAPKGKNLHFPIISADVIVWAETLYLNKTMQASFYIYDRKTGKIQELGNSNPVNIGYAVSGQKLVWTSAAGLEFYDLANQQRVILDQSVTSEPTIVGDTVTWNVANTELRVVDLKTISEKKKLVVKNSEGEQSRPKIAGNNLVWQDGGIISSLPLTQALAKVADQKITTSKVDQVDNQDFHTKSASDFTAPLYKGIHTANVQWDANSTKALFDQTSGCPYFGSFTVLSTDLSRDTQLSAPWGPKVSDVMQHLQNTYGARVVVRLVSDKLNPKLPTQTDDREITADAAAQEINNLVKDYPWIQHLRVGNEPNIEWKGCSVSPGCWIDRDRDANGVILPGATPYIFSDSPDDADSPKYQAINKFFTNIWFRVNYYKNNYSNPNLTSQQNADIRKSLERLELWTPSFAINNTYILQNIYATKVKTMLLTYKRFSYNVYTAPNQPGRITSDGSLKSDGWDSFPNDANYFMKKEIENGSLRTIIVEFGWRPSDTQDCNVTHRMTWSIQQPNPALPPLPNDFCITADGQNHQFHTDAYKFLINSERHGAEIVASWIVRGDPSPRDPEIPANPGPPIGDGGFIQPGDIDWVLLYGQTNP